MASNFVTLGDLTGHRPICYGVLKPGPRQESGVPLIRIKDIKHNELNDSDIYHISDDLHSEFKRSQLQGGEVLLSIQGTIGRVAICPTKLRGGNVSRTIAVIDPDARISNSFLRYWLLSQDGQFPVGGSTRASLNIGDIRKLSVPLPPLPEQRRIVGVLDAAFAGLATATAHTQKNLQNARELFDSKFQSALDSLDGDTPRPTLQDLRESGWIIDHMDGNHGGDYPRKNEFINEGVPYLSANAMMGGGINLAKAKFLSPARAGKLRKGFAKDGDVLFAHNATVGPVAILRTEEPTIVLGTSLTYYRCNREYILPEYLAHYMRSRTFVRQYEQVMGQSTRNQVPITKQREFFHVIPPLEEQKRIASQLDELLESTVRAQAVYQRKITALSELKQSILHRAFRGELSGDGSTLNTDIMEAAGA